MVASTTDPAASSTPSFATMTPINRPSILAWVQDSSPSSAPRTTTAPSTATVPTTLDPLAISI